MSRRRSRTSLDILVEADWEQAQAEQHFDTLPDPEPIPEDWRDQWAETTQRVIRIVWSKRGAKLYAAHRDALLREDLQSWLAVKAVEISHRYAPTPGPDAESRWAGYLHQALTGEAIHHFGDVVGRSERSSGRAAIDAYRRGISSTEALEEMESATGYTVNRRVLHAPDLFTQDPAVVFFRVTEFVHQVDEALKLPAPERSPWCTEAGCPRLAVAKGRCKAHYQRDRELWAEEDGRPACSVPDCGKPAVARGLCHTHHRHLLRGVLPEELHQYVQPLRSDVNAHGCTHEGCDKPAKNRGLCATHWRATRPPCSVPDCGKPAVARGLCQAHYARLRKGTLGDLTAYAKEPGQ